MAIKRGTRVRVTTHEFDTTPDGTPNDGYGYGTTGTVIGFRTNRFWGRVATVQLDAGLYVDWVLSDIEEVDE